jgi:flagellar basal-body rod protein FlgB
MGVNGVNHDVSDASIMTALGRQMTIAVAKQLTAAGNLANLDTPGYKTRAVTFDAALSNEMNGSPLAHPAGQGSPEASPSPVVREVENLPTRRDGNNVQLDRELLNMSNASGDFAAAQTALAAKFRLVRYAISEGR